LSINALSAKLPHYGKYGYLGFEGEAANNIVKGYFPALNSAMIFIDHPKDQKVITAKLEPRKALAY
jgi:aminopeptidase N